MTRASINNSIWILSLLLQGSLLVLVFVRGLRPRLPVFTLLLAFYPLRSAALFLLAASHLSPAAYAATYNSLTIVDLVLQSLVALEIARQLVASPDRSRTRRSYILLLPGFASAATYLTTRLLPAHTPIPPDRLQMFVSLTMILLCASALTRSVSPLLRRVTLGFAFYGMFGLMASAVRAFAAIHHDALLFAQWSYILSAAYLVVVVYWIAALKLDTSPIGGSNRTQASEEAPGSSRLRMAN